MITRLIWRVSVNPMFFQVLPPSADLYTPSPMVTLFRQVASPVPTQTISGWDGETAMSPTETVLSDSNTGFQEMPLFSDFQAPLGPMAA